MKILVTGASGLLGSQLVPRLRARGHDVLRLSRRADRADAIAWDPAAARFDASACADVDAVVHLAGESVAGGRWTATRKARIRTSRTAGTALLVERLAALPRPPRVFVGASAVGAYGDRNDEILTEASDFGTTFLASVCREWEAASAPIEAAGARRALLRIGVVLSKDGGALAKMLLPFRLGLGGVVGTGAQWWPWITLDDVVAMFVRAVEDDAIRGIHNATAPEPATNRAFTHALGRAMHRPTLVPLPTFAARLVLGELADLLLHSTRAVPQRFLAAGFEFADPTLDGALRRVLAATPS